MKLLQENWPFAQNILSKIVDEIYWTKLRKGDFIESESISRTGRVKLHSFSGVKTSDMRDFLNETTYQNEAVK